MEAELRRAGYDLVVPAETASSERSPLAKRSPEALRRPWGFIDTSKVNADSFIVELRRLVERDYGVETVCVQKSAPGVGISDSIAEDLVSRCGVVVSCFGD